MRSRLVPVAIVTLILVWLTLGGMAVWEMTRPRPAPTPAIEIELPAVPEDNAYDDFVKAAMSLTRQPEFDPTEDGPVPAEELETLEMAAPALAEVRKALGRACVAPLRTSLAQPSPQLSRFRWIAYLFVMESRDARLSGRAGECLDPLYDALRFAQAVGIGGDVIHGLTSSAMQSISLRELRHAVRSRTLTAKQLEAVIGFLQEFTAIEPPVEQAIEAEYQSCKAEVLAFDRQLRSGGRRLPPLMGYNANALIRRLEHDRYEALSLAELRYAELYRAEPQRTKKGFRIPSLTAVMGDTMSATFVVGCRDVVRSAKRISSAHRGTQLLVAIELYRLRHGHPPTSLDDLRSMKIEGAQKIPMVDPLSDEPFIYRRTGDDYWLYSVGHNLSDDGGQPRQRGRSDGPDDVVFHKPAAAETPSDS